MSSSSYPMTERLLCSICLEVFSDPVSTPCGHNFCKICLSTYWNNSQDCRCPNCKETFKQRPDLKINTTLRDVVDEHKKKCHEEQAEVVCDICSEGKLKAVKSCLVCQSSYCETHLEPHLRVSGLQKHKLIDPVKNLQDYICQKHDRPLELFCRDDQTSVCLSCADGDHKNHNTVPITESELQEMMEQRQRGAETHDEYVIKYLEQEISEMKKRNTEQQQKISNAENNLHLIQEKHQKDLSLLQNSSSGCSCMFWFLVVSVGVFLGLFAAAVHEGTQQRGAVLKWMQQYAVDVTLDPHTANPYLILSDDKKQVRHGDTALNLPNYWTRFDRYFNVLGKEGFSSGGFYFEVQVTGKTGWLIGVVRESVNRKGDGKMTAVNGFWTVQMKKKNDYVACVDADVSLSLIMSPQKVGVFVDYKAGKVSFYDAESGYHIYSFFGQYFTGKLFPVFNPCGNSEGTNSKPLIITPVKEMTHDISSIVNIKFGKMCKCMKESIFY